MPQERIVLPQNGIVGFRDRFVLFHGTRRLAVEAGALAGWQHRSGELVPDLDKEAGMVGFVQNRLGVVDVMLVAGVDDWMVGMKPFRFVSPMQVHPIHVKEECVGNKQKFHVGGHDEWEQHNRGRSNELIDVFVRNDRKGRRIVKGVMVLVKLPKRRKDVSQTMVEPFVQVGAHHDRHELKEMVTKAVLVVFRERTVGF